MTKLVAVGVGLPKLRPVDRTYIERHLSDAFEPLKADPGAVYTDTVYDAAMIVGRLLDVHDDAGKLVLNEAEVRDKIAKIAKSALGVEGKKNRVAAKLDIEQRISRGFAFGRSVRAEVVLVHQPLTAEEQRINERLAYLAVDEEARRRLRDRALGERASMASKLLTAAELAALPGLEPLIEGVLFRDSLAMLFGLPGSYKTFLAIGFACSIATGKKWLGRKVESGPVLYIAAEGVAGLGKRIEAWSAGWNDGKPVEELTILPETVNLSDEIQVDELAALNAERGFALIVVDTWARALGGADENSASATSLLIENVERIKRAHAGTTVLLIHHRGKSGTDPRGSIALLGGVDTALSLSGDSTSLVLEATKQKDVEGGIVETLEAARSSMADSLVLQRRSGSSSSTELPEHLDESLATFGRLFSETGATKSTFTAALVEQGLSRTTAYRHLNRLLETKRLLLLGTKLTLPPTLASIDDPTESKPKEKAP